MLLQDFHYDEAHSNRRSFSSPVFTVCVCENENYTEIASLTWESATVGNIVPIYRNIFIISLRTCVEV